MSSNGFASTLSAALADAGGTEFVRAHLEDYPAWAGRHTAVLEELGLPAMLVPESLDGIDLPMTEVVALTAVTGAAPSVDVVGRYVMAPLILQGADDSLLGQLAAGEARVSLAHRGRVIAAEDLTHALVLDGERAHIVDVTGQSGEVRTAFDQTSPMLQVDTTGSPTLDLDPAACTRALAAGRTALASEQAGLTSAVVAATVQHLKDRIEFGRPLASFQALKHRVADMWSAASMLSALVAQAAAALDAEDEAEAAIYSRAALAKASETAVWVTEDALQLHGGMGFTWESPIHVWLKRAVVARNRLGTPHALRAELAPLLDI